MPVLKLTDSAIEKLATPQSGTVWYSDPDLRGFQLAVGKQTRTFYALKSMGGKNVRVRLGKHPYVKAKVARELAFAAIGEISKGVDPRRQKTSTLRQVLEEYIERYSHASHRRLSASTVRQYRKVLELHCPKWLDRDIGAISKANVDKLHQDLRHKPYMANQLVRVLRAIFRHGIETLELPVANPTTGVKAYPEHARKTKINDWEAWFCEVQALPNVRRAYYLLAALTGIRRTNLATLRWDQINERSRFVQLGRIKNRTSPMLPLSAYACEILASVKDLDATWVFPANSKSGHIVEPKDNVQGRIHDLRRMFTTAAGQCHLPEYVIAWLRGDKVNQTQVQSYMDAVGDHHAIDLIGERLRVTWVPPCSDGKAGRQMPNQAGSD